MNQDHIRCFRTVAECLNYTQAAAALFITQPALSRTIQLLEDEIGAKLFVRTTHKVTLTAAGEVFYSRSKQILDAMALGIEDARLADKRFVGRITLGFYCDQFDARITRIVNSFRKLYPDIAIHMQDYRPEDMIAAFEENEIDVAFGPMVVKSPKAERLVIGRLRECVVLPLEHPLARRASVRLTELKDENFVALRHSALSADYSSVVRVASVAGFVPKIVASASLIPGVLMLVACGLGVTVLPNPCGALSEWEVVFVPIEGFPEVEEHLVWRSDKTNPCVRLFTQCARTMSK